jgi:hypothetical protein
MEPQTSALKTEARHLLTAPSTSALALLLCVRETFSTAFAWEPESLWLTLEQLGVDVPLINRAKIQAGITLIYIPSFYWDAVVFEKTALAFGDDLPHPDVLQEARPSQLAWAVVEARLIAEKLHLEQHEFDSEPRVYAAVVLHRAGLVVAPAELKFAQDKLDRLNVSGAFLRTQVTERLAQLGSLDAVNHTFEETAEGVQLGYLAAIKSYVDARREQLDSELARLA